MNQYHTVFFILIALFSFTSCEEVIELDLKDTEPRVIIEANGDMLTGICTVDITLSNGFYDTGDLERLNDATVVLTNESGTAYTLNESSPGHYQIENIDFETGQNYSLQVSDKDGNTYEALTTAPFHTELDSLYWEEQVFGFTGDTVYQMDAFWQDMPDVENFYRLRLTVNDTLQTDNYSLLSDEYAQGDYIQAFVPYFFDKNDKVLIQLMNIDEKTFDYFTQLSEVQGGSSAAPYNPQGNFGNKALGYFGIHYTSEREVVVE